MASNGNKVGWQSLHLELEKQNQYRDEMEERLIAAFAQGCKGIRDDMIQYHKDNDARVKCVEDDIVGLKVADRKWGGITGLFAAAITGLGVWFGQKS